MHTGKALGAGMDIEVLARIDEDMDLHMMADPEMDVDLYVDVNAHGPSQTQRADTLPRRTFGIECESLLLSSHNGMETRWAHAGLDVDIGVAMGMKAAMDVKVAGDVGMNMDLDVRMQMGVTTHMRWMAGWMVGVDGWMIWWVVWRVNGSMDGFQWM